MLEQEFRIAQVEGKRIFVFGGPDLFFLNGEFLKIDSRRHSWLQVISALKRIDSMQQ
jgi:hypothetical protein